MSGAGLSGAGPLARVQRTAETWPTLHLEAEVPEFDTLAIDGAVRHPRRFRVDELRSLGEEERAIALHCVWGWSRPDATWTGLDMGLLLSLVEPEGDWVTVSAASGVYSACLPRSDAERGVLAWARDGEPLEPMAGGPLRFVPPAHYWAYKGVKWAARITVSHHFRAGPWESRVADPMGRIPEEVLTT